MVFSFIVISCPDLFSSGLSLLNYLLERVRVIAYILRILFCQAVACLCLSMPYTQITRVGILP
jgi:hypothetical protein